MDEVYEEILAALSFAENEGRTVPSAFYREDGRLEVIWRGKAYVLTVQPIAIPERFPAKPFVLGDVHAPGPPWVSQDGG